MSADAPAKVDLGLATSPTSARAPRRELWRGDARDVCEALAPDVRFDAVYLDPPFNTGTAQARGGGARSYDDAWGGLDGFLAMLAPRVEALRARMRDHATLWLHLDHRAVHDAKVAVEAVLGRGAFRGEIIWVPGNGARSRRGPSATHQTLLVFARGPRCDIAWHTDDPTLREPHAATSLAMHFQRRDEAGRAYRERTIAGKTYRYHADQGRRLGSVWTDCPAMRANSPLRAETTGWPTQKPLSLMERVVRLSTREGDVVADLMCGSGSTLVAAARLGRGFVGGDRAPDAVAIARARLAALA